MHRLKRCRQHSECDKDKDSENDNDDDDDDDDNSPSVLQVIKMLIVIVVVYAACTLPWHITWLFSVYGYSDSVAKKICVLLVISVSAAHPIIYGTLNKDFARGFLGYTSCACSDKLPTVSGSFLRRRRKTIRKNTTRRFELQYDANNHDLNNVVQVSFTEDCYKDSAHAEIETVV